MPYMEVESSYRMPDAVRFRINAAMLSIARWALRRLRYTSSGSTLMVRDVSGRLAELNEFNNRCIGK